MLKAFKCGAIDILKIRWVDKIMNIEVLHRVQKETEILFTIEKRKLKYLGRLMRGEKYILLHNIMQGKIEGRRNPGRRKMSWVRNVRKRFGCITIYSGDPQIELRFL